MALARSSRMIRVFAALTACLALCATALAQDAEALRASHASLQTTLASNPFGSPLHVVSEDGASAQKGEVYAVADHPYTVVAPALRRNQAWCAILLLQVNVKRCEAVERDSVSVFFTRRADDPADQAYQVDLAFDVVAADEGYLRLALHGPEGPFGTRDYRIGVEATPLPGGQTFLHLSYSYASGWMARTGVRMYLAGSGREKVGFSVVDRRADGTPVFVEGVRGMIERNAMRNYLAVEAYLDSLDAPPHERAERRLRNWYTAIERYPLQLREDVSREQYLQTKRAQLGALPAEPPVPGDVSAQDDDARATAAGRR
jgi:hypothetical protein